jgi:hypothetical protein
MVLARKKLKSESMNDGRDNAGAVTHSGGRLELKSF